MIINLRSRIAKRMKSIEVAFSLNNRVFCLIVHKIRILGKFRTRKSIELVLSTEIDVSDRTELSLYRKPLPFLCSILPSALGNHSISVLQNSIVVEKL